jgi:hypothetical protein
LVAGVAYHIAIQCVDHNHPQLPAAPFLAGDLVFGGEERRMAFLVDTGATAHCLHSPSLSVPSKVLRKGKLTAIGGVGGQWPMRVIEGVVFRVQAVDTATGEEAVLEIPLSGAAFMAPYARVARDTGVIEEVLETPSPLDVRRFRNRFTYRDCPPAPHLLGRNAFVRHGLSLRYDPNGESGIEVPVSSGLVAPSPAEP